MVRGRVVKDISIHRLCAELPCSGETDQSGDYRKGSRGLELKVATIFNIQNRGLDHHAIIEHS